MIPLRQLINKIKWDPRENQAAYSFLYFDRVKGKLLDFAFSDIRIIEDGFIKIYEDGKVIPLPAHRIKQVKKNGKIIWNRLAEESSA